MTSDERSATALREWPWPALRIALSLVFLWAFLDKAFALGFSTGRNEETGDVDLLGAESWVSGASPTEGFLTYGVAGPFAPAFHSLAGNPIIDWLFMLGMGGVGIALLLGIAIRFSAICGAVLMLLLKLAVWDDPNNPIIDSHIVYAIALCGIASLPAARRWSLARWWNGLRVVKKVPVLT